ncbi:MAG TPA: hypothetical protein VF669_21885 [Tepidisphaeraceae bacterium]|jgi:hypothetical protein
MDAPTQSIDQHAPTPWDDVSSQPVVCGYAMEPAKESRSGGLFMIPLICVGIGLIAACLLIPAADENRRLAYESLSLRADLEQLEKQANINDQFLHRVSSDPTLAERLAQRQMKMVREGTSVLELKNQQCRASASPFMLVTLPPPEPLPAYQPMGGMLAGLCRQPRAQLYLMGGALLMIAAGLVLSHGQD